MEGLLGGLHTEERGLTRKHCQRRLEALAHGPEAALPFPLGILTQPPNQSMSRLAK